MSNLKLEAYYNDEKLYAEFDKNVHITTYREAIDKWFGLNDIYAAEEILFKDQYIKPEKGELDLSSDDNFIQRGLFLAEVGTEFLSFNDVDILEDNDSEEYKNLTNKYKVKLLTLRIDDEKNIYLKPLTRQAYQKIYNCTRNGKNILYTWEKVYEELKISENKINTKSIEFISLLFVMHYMLNIKGFSLRSKIDEYAITDKSSEIDKIDAYILYYFKINPMNLTDDEYAYYYTRLKWVLEEMNSKSDTRRK